MREALKEARKAFEEDEVPVGAVIVKDGQLIARAHNQTRRLRDPTAHAEILAITQASNYLKSQFLIGCHLYVTVEPCIMCCGAILMSRLEGVIFGTSEPEFGAFGSILDLTQYLTSLKTIKRSVLEPEARALLRDFFKRKRLIGRMERWLSG